MPTTVTYNGIEMHNVTTRMWDQEIVYDESKADVLFQRFHLQFDGVLHVQHAEKAISGVRTTPTFIAPDDGGSAKNPKLLTFYEKIMVLLSEPRRPLVVFMGADKKVVLHCVPTGGDTIASSLRDVEGGPKPKNVRITQIVADKVFRIQFDVECSMVKCGSGAENNPIHPVLNNRWAVEEEMDEDFFTTRTIRGKIRFSSNNPFLPALPTGHALKALIVPVLERGFRREKLTYSVAESGLEATYMVIDRQVHTAAPWPATRISGTYTESTGNGVTNFAEMQVRLDGSPEASKRDLLTMAVQVVDSRLLFLQKKMNTEYKLEQAAVIDYLGDRNAIEFRMRIQRMPQNGDQRLMFANLFAETVGQPLELPQAQKVKNAPGYDKTVSRVPAVFGYDSHGKERNPIVLMLVHCYQQSACSPIHSPYNSDSSQKPEKEKKEKPPPFSVEPSSTNLPAPEYPLDKYRPEARQAMFTHASMSSKYVFVGCRAHLPIAKFSDAADSKSKSKAKKTVAEDTSVFVSLAPQQCRRVIVVTAQRLGGWPEIPEPLDEYTDGTLKGMLLEYQVSPAVPVESVEPLKRLYEVSARYVYGLNRAPTSAEKLRVGVLPMTAYKPNENLFDQQKAYAYDNMDP